MASTYSSNLRLELIGTGDQQGTWGITTNTNLGTLLEEAIGGYVSVTVSDSGDTTLTVANGSTDQSRNMVINLTGTISAARTVICPAIEKLYVVKNATTGGYAVTFKVSGQTGVSIPNGSTYFVYVNGTDVQLVNGTIASQNSNNVSITGGSISGAALSNVTVVANASSLSVRDADGSHVLSIAAGSNLTANRVLTLTTGDAARTLDISSGNVTISTAGASLIDDADAAAQRTTLGVGTGDSPEFLAVNIGNASDTTLARVSAGVAAIEGKNIALNGTSETLTTGTIELGDASDTTLTRASAGVLAIEGVNALLAGKTDTISKGFTVTPNNIGAVSSGTVTPAPADGNYQYYANDGAHTLSAPTSDCAIDILVTNGASAGAITFSGFTVGANTGSALTTTNGHRFIISIRRINAISTYSIYALQ